MKKLLIFIALMCSIASAGESLNKVHDKPSKNNGGDVWEIYTKGYIEKFDTPHLKEWHSNGIKVKWNIAKGRVSVECGQLCDRNETFAVFLFDRDTLRIDYLIVLYQESGFKNREEFIVPEEYRNDISYMLIVPENPEKWRHKFSLECEDGYTPFIPAPEQEDGAWTNSFYGGLFATSACFPADSEEDPLELWLNANNGTQK